MRPASLTDEVTLYAEERVESGTSIFGDPEYEPATGIAIPAFVTPLDATEDEVNRDVRINRYTVHLDLDADLDGLSEIEWQGRRYEVRGEPRRYSNHRGGDHYEVEVRGVEG